MTPLVAVGIFAAGIVAGILIGRNNAKKVERTIGDLEEFISLAKEELNELKLKIKKDD